MTKQFQITFSGEVILSFSWIYIKYYEDHFQFKHNFNSNSSILHFDLIGFLSLNIYIPCKINTMCVSIYIQIF